MYYFYRIYRCALVVPIFHVVAPSAQMEALSQRKAMADSGTSARAYYSTFKQALVTHFLSGPVRSLATWYVHRSSYLLGKLTRITLPRELCLVMPVSKYQQLRLVVHD